MQEPTVIQIHDETNKERTISLILRQHSGHLMIEAHTRLKATDEPWYSAIGAVAIEISNNKLQVQLYDRVGIEQDMVHWRLPDDIGLASLVLAENVDGSEPQDEEEREEEPGTSSLREEERSALMATYQYKIDLMTHQVLYQTLKWESDHELSTAEINEAIDQHIDPNGWEAQKQPDKQVDVDSALVTLPDGNTTELSLDEEEDD